MIRALAITVSNRASAGIYEDKSGPVLAQLLAEAGCEVAGPLVIPDGSAVELALQAPSAAGGVTAEPSGPEAKVAAPGGLTPRELQIVALIAEGHSNKAIGEELVISPATAARHVANILLKLGFSSRTQIAAWASRSQAGSTAERTGQQAP